ncbi:MAG: GH92 family glycosyl hydrolase, partial [Pyrinomonadaceae bacterium]
MKRILFILILLPAISFAQTRDYTKWVNPFIGTGGHGHTFPGATMPFGMVQLSPDTRIDNWDGSSGYHYSDDIIYGFSHTHLSGTGIPDGCDILFMPTVGDPQFFAKEGDKSVNGYASKFSHANEKAEPGYYSVKLDDDGILAEMTATKRVGFHRYTFPKTQKANIVVDLKWRDKALDSELKVVGNNRIEGSRRSSSWAKDQTVYFVAEFSKNLDLSIGEIENVSGPGGTRFETRAFHFKTLAGEKILIKVAISFVSIEGARKNLEAELPGWNFDKVRADAKAAWNKELSKIEVSGGTDDQTTTFYSALYHTMIHPNVFNDVDGRYKGHDGKIHNIAAPSSPPYEGGVAAASADGVVLSTAGNRHENGPKTPARNEPPRRDDAAPLLRKEGRLKKPPEGGTPTEHYTVFSLWDTFRAAHPLYTIIDQKRTVDFINTFIRQYEQGGRLPVWELWGEETDTMIGYHAVSVIADAMAKGIKGFDYEKAYAASKHSAELNHFGLAAYKKRGYISSEDEQESVSKTLEYAYNDWCIAQMAGILKKGEDFNKYDQRARYFENLFDPETGFMRPKQNGGFVKPFRPGEVTFHFTEGNSWVYSFFVPQDINRLMELHGGRDKFASKLDELFNTTEKLSGREQPDITGLIGQYAHGNEPSHHIAYLYDYAQQPWKTQRLVRKIMDEFYKPEPDGLIGNEDCGQMSAWYILSASGFYQVTPGLPIYAFGTPLFKETKYNLENGKTFTIKASNVSATNIYIKSARLNGRDFPRSSISHQQIMDGGMLEFEMSDTPITQGFPILPKAMGGTSKTVAVPIIEGDGRVFQHRMTVTLRAADPKAEMIYTTGDKWKVYTGPFAIDKTTNVKAIAGVGLPISSDFGNDLYRKYPHYQTGRMAEATFYKKPNNWTVKIDSKYNRQYTGGGDEGLIDGLRGTLNFASGEW